MLSQQNILVINAGSSSIKYQLIDTLNGVRLAGGLIERIGEGVSAVQHSSGDASLSWEEEILDHAAGFEALRRAFAEATAPLHEMGLVAVGHRVVQGGSEFVQPTLIDDYVQERILELALLAPLHNPAHHSAIVAARAAFPDVPHVAVFDTAFHQSMPEDAYTYAIPRDVAEEYGVRRYGFHGISHQVVSRRAAEFLGRPVSSLKQIVLHLGNGASACAIDGGMSVDTSMGLTPLAGLVMGTRSGDLDPGVLLHLMRHGMSADDLDRMLNKNSGLAGLYGSNDVRDLRDGYEAGDDNAALALAVYARRVRHYIGAYLAELGGADTIVFTAGVGENSALVRSLCCRGLEGLGIVLDAARNTAAQTGPRVISTDTSPVTILVVPTDEEAEIARQTAQLGGFMGG